MVVLTCCQTVTNTLIIWFKNIYRPSWLGLLQSFRLFHKPRNKEKVGHLEQKGIEASFVYHQYIYFTNMQIPSVKRITRVSWQEFKSYASYSVIGIFWDIRCRPALSYYASLLMNISLYLTHTHTLAHAFITHTFHQNSMAVGSPNYLLFFFKISTKEWYHLVDLLILINLVYNLSQ